MTATPRYFTDRVIEKSKELEYEMASMDDEKKYGPVFHQLTFGQAIKQDLLSDYQVVIISASEKERKMAEEAVLVRTNEGLFTDARTFAAQIGLAKAIKKYDLHKIITFHSSVAKAKRFADAEVLDSLPSVIKKLPTSSRPSGEIWTSHISGLTPTGRRKTLLNQFAAFPNTTRAILTNCACLGEGVDVPTLDGVAFIDPKRSQVDIIQAVGRVIRKAPGVGVGTIVIPVFIDESEDEETVLTSSAFKPVWQVIRALRAHDEVLAEELDELRLKLGKRSPYGGKVKLPAAIKVDIPTLVFKDFERAFNVRTVEATTSKPNLTIEQILAWADEHKKRTGEWPSVQSGEVHDVTSEKWSNIDAALSQGLRGFSGGSSLAKLLAEKREVRNRANLPSFTIDQILKWADEHHGRTHQWPKKNSGSIVGNPEDTWGVVHNSLSEGLRGLSGGSSLAKLLEEKKGVRNIQNLPRLTHKKILELADKYHVRTKKWPNTASGNINTNTNENWRMIDNALRWGLRGLPGQESLAQLLSENRGIRNQSKLPKLTITQILAWADEHYKRTNKWPNLKAGAVSGAPEETWLNIDSALQRGQRGLPAGSSLAKLLADKREIRNKANLPVLSVNIILEWADHHYKKTRQWPNAKSGQVSAAQGETWANIAAALNRGGRGLPGNSSLAKLLSERRQVRIKKHLPRLTTSRILLWANDHKRLHGKWPAVKSGAVHMSSDEKWANIDDALRIGNRGLPGGSSLAKLLAKKKTINNK